MDDAGPAVSEEGVDALLAAGILRRVEPDREAAERELAAARQHLSTADEIADVDEIAALAIAYEGARKAIRAHMRARGLRTVGGEGAHARTGEYGVAAFDQPHVAMHFRAFDDVRKLRNRSQYDAVPVEDADVTFALKHAREIVSAVETDLA